MDSIIATDHNTSELIYASTEHPCPICGKEDWCSLKIDSSNQPFLSVCGRGVEPPAGWNLSGPSKDGRSVFIKAGRNNRQFLKTVTSLKRETRDDLPQWKFNHRTLESLKVGDLVRATGTSGVVQLKQVLPARGDGHGQRVIVGPWQYNSVGNQELFMSDIQAVAIEDNRGEEQTIEYLYPSPDSGAPLGMVRRTQWSDRRPVYHSNRRNKLVLPHRWNHKEKRWELGKGEDKWPLYREDEARDCIGQGGVLFIVGGEQAVEAYRGMGLTATCTAGGEHNWRDILEALAPYFGIAKERFLKPLLVIHPDFDIVGDQTFAVDMLGACRQKRFPAIALNPLELWGEMPHKGDIKDWIDSGIEPDAIVRTLETAINTEIDYEEQEIKGRIQRALWKAPESHNGELGIWKVNKKDEDDRTFFPLADFDFQIERELADSKGGGLLLQFKRADDRNQRRVFIKSTDYTSANKFIDALKKSIYGGVICNLQGHQIQALIRVRLHEYRVTRRGKVFRLVERVGQQDNGTWVFPNMQLDKFGNHTTEEQSRWCWHTDDDEGGSHLPKPSIKPPDSTMLKRLVDAMHKAFGPTIIHQAILTLGYAAATAHYKAIMEHDRSFPLYSVYADAGCGKTTMAECAIALFGMTEEGIFSKITTSAMFEKLKLGGSLLYCLDDPKREKDSDMEEDLKAVYNGHPRTVRGKDNEGFNSQKPYSPLMITANAPLGEKSQALRTRMIQIFVPKRDDIDRDAFAPLRALFKDASSALPTLIKFGYDPEAIQALEKRLRPLMPHANGRFPQSLSIILHYAKLVCAETQLNIDIQGWVEANICPEFNDTDQSGNSLRDFLEKLFVLKAEAKVGEWNVRIVNKHNSEEAKGLAIHMASVWPQLDQAYSLPYNRKIIERLFIDKGAIKEVQRFHENRDVSITYSRAGQGNKVNLHPRKCLLIPLDVVKEFSDIGVTEVTEATEDDEKPEPHEQQSINLLPNINNNKVTNNNNRLTEVTHEAEGDSVTLSANPLLTSPLPNEVTPQPLEGTGVEGSVNLVTSVTAKVTPTCEQENQEDSVWIQCDNNHKPPIGAHVRIVAGKQKGATATVARLHAVQVGVKLDSGVNTLEDYSNLEMILDRDDFMSIDGKLYKIVKEGIKYLVVVKGDRGRKQYAYTRETKELREMKSNASD